MPIKLKEGEQRAGLRYKVLRRLSDGAMAKSYEAEVMSGSRTGESVFLKQYISPSVKVPWFDAYVSYQKELKKRIESDGDLKARCYEMFEFIVNKGGKDASGVFYQVFEFVKDGIPLTKYIEDFREDPTSVEWKHRVIFARIMMFALDYLHRAKIVHTDLKPDNFFMIPGENKAGFKLKLIDLDFAILADQQSPWHGESGYVGTPGYHSPEHLRGEVPQGASDIYTCGLILSELLGEGHPLRGFDNIEQATLNGEYVPVKIAEPIQRVENLGFLEGVINACFQPDPAKRPNARQLLEALQGKTFDFEFPEVKSPAPEDIEPEREVPEPTLHTDPTPTEEQPKKVPKVELYYEDNKVAGCSIDTVFGHNHFRAVSDEAKFIGKKQFTIYKDRSSGTWAISHIQEATNETVVNGASLKSPVFLQDGMTISVGNTSKGVEKFPMTIRFQNA